jgi:copper chaperone NosL
MPWIVAGLIVLGLAAAASGRRAVLYTWLAALLVAAAAGLADFWYWGYDYGHNLDPSAAIKVPGMSYQPPIIGPKTLLNFRADSWPDLGGLIAFAVVGAAGAVAFVEFRRARRRSQGTPVEPRLARRRGMRELAA